MHAVATDEGSAATVIAHVIQADGARLALGRGHGRFAPLVVLGVLLFELLGGADEISALDAGDWRSSLLLLRRHLPLHAKDRAARSASSRRDTSCELVCGHVAARRVGGEFASLA